MLWRAALQAQLPLLFVLFQFLTSTLKARAASNMEEGKVSETIFVNSTSPGHSLGCFGILLIGDAGVAARIYQPLAEEVDKRALVMVPVAIVGVADEESDARVLGRIIQAMAHVDAGGVKPEHWGVVGHGNGAKLAATLASTMYPRVKALAALGAPESFIESAAALGDHIYTLVVTAGASEDAPSCSTSGAKHVALPEASHMDLVRRRETPAAKDDAGSSAGAAGPIENVVDELAKTALSNFFYDLQHEGKAALQGDDAVSVETDRERHWTVFRPLNTTVKAGIVFFQGAGCPWEAYGALLASIAARGYLSVIVAAVNRDSRNRVAAPAEVIPALADSGVENWFVGGHSMGGGAALAYALDRQVKDDRLPKARGILLFAGGPNGFNVRAADSEGAVHLPCIQVFGSQDRSTMPGPFSDPHRYLDAYLLPVVPAEFVSAVQVMGGSHYGWGYYGHQKLYATMTITREEQIEKGVAAAAEWMEAVLAGERQLQPSYREV